MSQTAPRLFVDYDLAPDAAIPASDAQAHYLLSVMRRQRGDDVLLFNGRHGEWRAQVEPSGKRGCTLSVIERHRVQQSDADLWLVFAPVKNARLEIMVEKATELGVSRLVPILTERTIVRRVNRERLQAHAVEAAEQSNRLSVPEVTALVELDEFLSSGLGTRRLIYADEIGPAPSARAALGAMPPKPSAVLIGPEGGFSVAERTRILEAGEIVPLSLGPRLLRADTAALAALALVQAMCGDGVE